MFKTMINNIVRVQKHIASGLFITNFKFKKLLTIQYAEKLSHSKRLFPPESYSSCRKLSQRLKLRKTLALIMVFVFLSTQAVYPLPQGAEVIEGTADVTVDGTTMTITADSGTIINYSSFDIASNESVIVNMPDASSELLNRVLGPDASNLAGSLFSNGIFILINTHGIYIAPTSIIDAQGLVLSTRDITNSDFLNHEYLFQKISEEQLDMLLTNAGTINIREGGFGVLIAGAIENEGIIAAPLGRIELATGKAVRLDISGGGLISVAIEVAQASQVLDFEGNPITDQLSNTGEISADGGIVMLKADSLTDIFTKAINLKGYVHANTYNEQEGLIKLAADGDVTLNAELEATKIDLEGGNIGVEGGNIEGGIGGTVESFFIDGYTGTISLGRAFTITGDYTQNSGTFRGETHEMTIGGDFTHTGGSFYSPSNNIYFRGSLRVNFETFFESPEGTVHM